MRRAVMASLLMTAALVGCDNTVLVPVGDPAPPRNLDAYYYAGVVRVTWELAPDWNQETFRVYSKRLSDPDWFLIAEVSSCANGVCTYEDINIVPGQSYEYYVSAVDPGSGVETPSDYSVQVDVPEATPPPVPTGFQVVALDHANYLRWSGNARQASDFSFYRVYFDAGDGNQYLLGETDSEGFLDQLAQNGQTYRYYVTSVDDQGHESQGSGLASGTPRPDYHGEWLYDFFDQPTLSGFRFQADETTNPIVDGGASDRHFRLEVDDAGWWLVPGPGTEVYPTGFETTALKCGVAAQNPSPFRRTLNVPSRLRSRRSARCETTEPNPSSSSRSPWSARFARLGCGLRRMVISARPLSRPSLASSTQSRGAFR